MDLLKSELEDDYTPLGFRNKRKHLRTLKQTNVKRLDKDRDSSRKALMPGKRISKTGKVYWETRKNRSDTKGKKV